MRRSESVLHKHKAYLSHSTSFLPNVYDTGVPGAKITLFTVCLTVASFVIGWISGLGETDFTAADGTVTTAAWVTIVDAFCVSIGILFVAAAIAVIVSMTGIMTKNASK